MNSGTILTCSIVRMPVCKARSLTWIKSALHFLVNSHREMHKTPSYINNCNSTSLNTFRSRQLKYLKTFGGKIASRWSIWRRNFCTRCDASKRSYTERRQTFNRRSKILRLPRRSWKSTWKRLSGSLRTSRNISNNSFSRWEQSFRIATIRQSTVAFCLKGI